MALCNLLLAFQITPEGVVIIRLIQGLVSGFLFCNHYINSVRVLHQRTGWALGLLASANLAGSLIGPLLGGYIADTIGIRNDFILVGILMVFSWII